MIRFERREDWKNLECYYNGWDILIDTKYAGHVRRHVNAPKLWMIVRELNSPLRSGYSYVYKTRREAAEEFTK